MLNGQTKMVSNEVNHQSAASVAKSAAPNATNSNVAVADQQPSPQGQNSNRTQDDAMVSYVFQRQNDAEYQPYPKSSRWFGTEEPNMIDNNGPSDTQELEAGFNSLALESEGFASTKKIWGVEDKHSEDAKALFISDSHQWGRDSTWSTTGNSTGENGGLSDHAVSQPIMVKRGSNAYGADGTLLSPRSTDTGGIGMKMAEYVLNNSPSSKDNLDSRMHSRLLRDHDKVVSQSGRKTDKDVSNVSHPTSNGLTNGFGPSEDSIESNKLFNRAPGIPHQIDENAPILPNNKPSVMDSMMMPNVGHPAQFPDFGSEQLSSGAIPNIDGLPSFGANDYVNHLLPSATDSPNLIEAYTNNLYQQQRNAAGPTNNQMSMLSNQQQHLGMTAQQQNLGPTGVAATIGHPAAATGNTNIFTAATQSTQNPYFSDPFMSHMLATGAPGPAAMAMSQYYGFPPAWNMYPGLMPNATTAGGQLQGQAGHPSSMQQQMRGNNASSNRPLSPNNVQNSNDHNSANSQALAAIQAQAAAAASQTGFPMIPLAGTPSGFYDQNSLSALAAGRGLPSAMHRIMPPQMNMLQTQAAMNNGNMRMLPNSTQNAQAPNQSNPLFPNSGPNNGNGNGLYTSVTNSGLGYNNLSSGIFSANGHNPNQPMVPQQMGFHNPGIGPIGASIQSGMGNNGLGGANSPRRDSMDGRSSNAVGLGGIFPNMVNDTNMGAFSRHMAGTINNANSTGKGNPVGMNNNLANAAFYGMGINSPGPMGIGMPGQSMTPPPMNSMDASMNGFANALAGPNNSLYLNGMRLMNAASDNKYLARNGMINQNAAFAAASGMNNFSNGTSTVINNANAGMHFNHSNGMQQVSNQPNNNYSNNGNNRVNTQRTRSVEKNVGRSTLLEDFRNSRLPNLALRDLTDHIVEFSQDQHGSRFIQQKLERAIDDEKQLVFSEIIGQAYQLMTDVFGNYVIQKFFEFGTPTQKQSLAQTIRGNVLNLALQMYGCRVIQKALESIPSDQQKDIVKELDGHVLKCVKDQNGNHVVQKCIECIEPSALQFIISAFQGQVLSLSTHPYGCRVIQRILEHCNPEQTSSILQELHQNTESLVQDQYGNYVVQHVLEHGRPEDKTKIILMVRGKVLTLSQHKFASNVVERCITQAMRSERAILIDEVCNYNDNALYTMMKDQYANYVVQKMIEVADSQQRKALLLRIRPHMNSLRRFTYGKHILAKLEKFMNTSSKSSSAVNGGTAVTASTVANDNSLATVSTAVSNSLSNNVNGNNSATIQANGTNGQVDEN